MSPRNTALLLLLATLSACGGGGSSNSPGSTPLATTSTWTQGIFQPQSTYAAKCATPRTGASATTGKTFPDTQGTALDERNWLRSWTHDLYLWYSEVPDRDPSGYTTPAYFDLLKTTATTPSGAPKDKFHFTYTTAQWEALSQNGAEAGYGLQWDLLAATPPRKLLIAYLEPNPPAATQAAQLHRGDEITSIDGMDIDATASTQIDQLNAGIYPANPNQQHTFGIRTTAGVNRQVTLTSASVTDAPVMNTQIINTGTGFVGYIQFNNHLYPAEQALIDAFNTFKAA